MQIGVTQIVFPTTTPTAAFAAEAAAAGYQVVELSMRREGDLTPQASTAQRRDIARAVRDAGMQIVCLALNHCTGNLLIGGDAQRLGLDETRLGLQAAADMGITCTLHTLGRLSPQVYYEDSYRFAVESLRTLGRDCEALGVDIAVEFIWNGFAFSPLEMKRLLDEVGSPRIGFYFDPGNMAVFQTPHHWVHALGRHVKRVHLKDWRGRALDGGWPPLLEGQVDFPAVMRELRAIGYDGPLVSEVPPSVAPLATTAQAIRKIMSM